MMVQDLGLTFGRVDILNRNPLESVNFERWSQTPIWKNDPKKNGPCVGNLPKSLSGSMHDPVISEDGRLFLAQLLAQLSDAQLQDLFEVARFPLRSPLDPSVGSRASVNDWVGAFKSKRDEIAAGTARSAAWSGLAG